MHSAFNRGIGMKRTIAIAVFCLLSLIPEAQAREYESGYRALEVFDAAGWESMPLWVKAWTVSSTLCFALGFCFVRRHPVARWVMAGWATALFALVVLGELESDLFRLAGLNALAHCVFWSPALVQLLSRRPFLVKEPTPFSIWSGGITAIMLFSFVFDIPYSLTYLRHVFSVS